MKSLLLSFFRIVALIKKEFITLLMDKGSRTILIMPVIIQSFIFGYGANYDLEHIPYTVFNADRGSLSADLVRTIGNTPRFELAEQCFDLECVKSSVDEQRSLIGLYLGSDFSKTKELDIMVDARNTASANTAASYINNIVESYNDSVFGSLPVSFNQRFLFNENSITRFSILTGMILALSIIQVLMLSSFTVSREKEEGTFDMMLMTPASPIEMLLGKGIPPVVVACAQGCLLFLICRCYFEIPFRGKFLDLFLVISLFSVATVGLGLAISTLVKTSMQSLVISFTLVLPFIMASGLLTSAAGMPAWFLYVARIDPLYYGINAIWQIYLEGKSFYQVLYLMLPLAGLGVFSLSVSAYLFRNRLD